MSSFAQAYEHVVGTLLTDEEFSDMVDGRIYQGAVPVKVNTWPVVLVQPYGDAVSYLGIGPTEAARTVEVSVRVIGPASSLTTLETILDAAHALLQATDGSTDRGTVASCVRVAETDMTEVSDGELWRYLGARYRLLVTA